MTSLRSGLKTQFTLPLWDVIVGQRPWRSFDFVDPLIEDPSVRPIASGILVALATALAVLPKTGGTQPEVETAALRQAFIAAYRNAEFGRSAGVADPALESYVLYEYIEAARINHALSTAGAALGPADETAEAFIATHRQNPIGRAVETAWLQSLADRGLDAALVKHYSPAAAGIALECRYLQARLTLGDTRGLDAAIRERWLTGAQLPLACEPVFEWGRAHGAIDTEATAARVRLLLENGEAGFARVITRRLPDDRAAPLDRWAELITDPTGAFDALIAAPASSPGETAMLDAWARFTRDRPRDALLRLDALIDALDPDRELTSTLNRSLALGLAWNRDPEALTHFSRVRHKEMDDYTREWQARAALWSDQWPTAADTIAAMSETTRMQSAWRYWSGRAEAVLGAKEAAAEIFASLGSDDNFYAALASARLGRPHIPASRPLQIDERVLASVATLPAFLRARELHAIGMETEARREWNAGYADLPDAQKRASIRLAAGWGWHEIAVMTATMNDVFYDYALLYPLRYTDHVLPAAELADTDRSLLYALIRQESLFAPTAVSSAGAIGLTQLKLETARRAASRWSLERPSRAALFDPATNVRLGAAELRNLIDEFDGQLLPALAGYNAGYYAAERWLPAATIAADVWVENIPYNETRAYVRRVLWHSLVYAWLETGQGQDASRWLTPVRRP